MAAAELMTLVIYDISNDRVRTKVSEICLDYGLHRIQFSAFEGLLTRNRRQDLALRMADQLRDVGGKITLIPICQTDVDDRIDLEFSSAECCATDHQPTTLRVIHGEED